MTARIYGVPLYADVSALFYNKDLFRKAGLDPDKPPTSLAEIREYADKITRARRRREGLFHLAGSCAGCNIFTVGPLMWASGATIEPQDATDEPLQATASRRCCNGPATDDQGWRNVHETRAPRRARRSTCGSAPAKIGMMGTGSFNITLAKSRDPEMDFGIALLPGVKKRRGRVVCRRRHRHHSERQQARRRCDRLHEVPAVG